MQERNKQFSQLIYHKSTQKVYICQPEIRSTRACRQTILDEARRFVVVLWIPPSEG